MPTTIAEILALAEKRGTIRPADLVREGLPPRYLSRLCQRGDLVRLDRGLYEVKDRPVTEHVTLAAAAHRVPHGVVCLLSALQVYELTTQQPPKVWLAIDRKARTPRVEALPIRIVRFSGKTFTEGVQSLQVETAEVRVYSPAKTVADCFKYRNKLGLDVALEALRECRRSRKATTDELWRYAKICRVANVMQPYLEAVG